MVRTLCSDDRCLFSLKANEVQREKCFAKITTLTREGKGLWERCSNCGLAINRSGVDPSDAENYYNEEYVNSHSYSVGEILTPKQHFEQRLDTIKPIYDSIKHYLKPYMNVLEIGCATGELLHLIKSDVSSVFGIDAMKEYVDFCKTELDINGSSDDYLNLKFPKPFDFIVTINTVDHIYKTGDVLSKIFSDLKAGGYLYIEIPNDEQALNKKLPESTQKDFTAFMYQKAHYYSFAPKVISDLLLDKGFELTSMSSRHDYTFVNYLNWYFLGKPQKSLSQGMINADLQIGGGDFDLRLNSLMREADKKFRDIMKETMSGETISILARKPL